MDRHAHVLYCDDIRHELGGKITFVGAYGASLLVNEFPVTMPKLCARLDLVTPASRLFEHIEIQILLNEKKIGDLKLASDELNKSQPEHHISSVRDDQSELAQTLHFDFVFSPIQLDAPGRLRIIVNTESEELQVLSLSIGKM
ncbi:DUF6941 family protein [Halopseudomonas bauzanensis]|uniref:Uncharacterized protein n=1 Tax=Halopseudomonas bauzanensis TaxID=653930 RepID=A0A4U0YKX7_9GAMM|nr:hypothetical protein [Halopseudomonas bauzanensis]TKA90374.1 hypothetical protein FA869_14750 [Halopseudomonas bauzanensis]